MQKKHYVPVSKGLLTIEHKERMGIAVWEFMRCLDWVTKIDSEGWGIVLGGKPVQLRDFELGSDNLVSAHLSILKNEGYITTVRTPYGMIIRVKNAQKRFTKNQESDGGENHEKSRITKKRDSRNFGGDSRKTVDTKKTVSTNVDTKDISGQGDASVPVEPKQKFSHLGAEVVKAFEEIDPVNKKHYSNTTQRKAADFLVETYGLETVLKIIKLLPKTNKLPYFPSITTPHSLANSWVKLHDKLVQKKGEIIGKGRGLA